MWLPGWSKIKFLLCKEETPMKKNLGPVLALYPTPLVVVGTMVGGKPN